VDERGPSPRVRPRAARKDGGSERPNIADIAALAKVSTSAVSYALNGREGVADSTRQRILEIAASLNWRPNSAARSLMTERASAVGIVNLYDPTHPVLSAEFTGPFLVGLQHELRRHDMLLTMHMVDDYAGAQAVYRRWLGERRVDGVLVLNPTLVDSRLDELERLGMPTVVVGDVRRRPTLVSAWTDDAAATDLAVDHLVGLGHRAIGWIGGDPAFQHVDIRAKAFRRAMQRHGLAPDDRVGHDGPSWEGVAELVRDPKTPLTAVVIEDSEPALAAVTALSDLGVSIPDELSVIAWDDSSKTTLVRPSLTVLRRDIEEYGRAAARALVSAIDTGERKNIRGTHAELVQRESTAPRRR
jgi:DNA-binding LacI/PurR family transcriptional regulator